MVDGHYRLVAELLDVFDVLGQVGKAPLAAGQVGGVELGGGGSAVVAQGAYGGHQYHSGGGQARVAALDVEKLLGPEVGPETGFRHHVVAQREAHAGGQHGIGALGNVGEGPAVDQGGGLLQGLHQVGLQRIAQQNSHGGLGLQLAGVNRLVGVAERHQDVAELGLEVGQAGGQAQDGHDLGGGRDVEAVGAHHPVGFAAQPDDDLAQAAVVQVEAALPEHGARVDVERVVGRLDGVVEQGGQQVIGLFHGVEVAGEVQVDVHHRAHLRAAAAGSPAFGPEHGPQRGLAQHHHGLFAQLVQAIAQADGYRGFAFAGRGGGDGRDENQLGGSYLFQVNQVQGQLGLVATVGLQVVLGNAQAGGHFFNWRQDY